MRATCQAFRNSLDGDMMKRALIKLERDNGESKCWDVLGMRIDRISAPGSLTKCGYSVSDASKLFELVPCYTCLSAYPFKHFEFIGSEFRQQRGASILSRGFSCYSIGCLAGAEGTRKCVTCMVETENRPNTKDRWVLCSGGGIVLCKGCDKKVWQDHAVPGRQKATNLCKDCFRKRNKNWVEDKEKLQEPSRETWQVARFRFWTGEAEALAVDGYLHWTGEVDNGKYKIWHSSEIESEWFTWPCWENLAKLEGFDGEQTEYYKRNGEGGIKEGEKVNSITGFIKKMKQAFDLGALQGMRAEPRGRSDFDFRGMGVLWSLRSDAESEDDDGK